MTGCSQVFRGRSSCQKVSWDVLFSRVQVMRALETRLSFTISHMRAEHQGRRFQSRQPQTHFSPFAPDLCPIRVNDNFCLHPPQMLTPVGVAGMVRSAEKERVFSRRSQGSGCSSEPGSSSSSVTTLPWSEGLLLGKDGSCSATNEPWDSGTVS